MYQRIGIFSLCMGDGNAFPWPEVLYAIEHVLAPAPEGYEPDALLIETGELSVGGKLGVKDECRPHASLNLFPEGEKREDLIVDLIPLNVGGGVENQLGGGILGKQGKSSFHPFVSGPSPMLLKHGFLAKVWHGMEVQIDDVVPIPSEPGYVFDKGALELKEVNRIQAVGIGGHGRTLGQRGKPCEETEAWVECMIPPTWA